MRPRASNTSTQRTSRDAFEALECSDVVTDVVTAKPLRRTSRDHFAGQIGIVLRGRKR
jgi:hypothetical protein